VGFDDIDEAALSSPALTTIRLSPRSIGNVAAETLIERLKGRQEPKSILIEGTLIIRQSTAEPVASQIHPSTEAAQPWVDPPMRA
jgi:LacI family transcriptional regulator